MCGVPEKGWIMLRDFKILYAEDEDFIRESMVEALSFFCDNIRAVADGKAAYEAYKEERPDILIADIEMPKMNGLELVKKIRKEDKETQAVITTAYTNTEYFLKAVELNLVKYLLKPIAFQDLKDTLVACAENLKHRENPYKYINEKDYFDPKEEKLVIGDEEVYLDFQERKFLSILVKHPGHVVTYEELENTIWRNGLSEGAVRTLVFNLRKKLPSGTIKNVPKTGYKITIKE